jgi:4-hydroxybenzoyl-CoA thioesterase
MKRFERAQRIRFSDCDPAGIVFYPQYFVMFNGLVEAWFDDELRILYSDVVATRRVGLPTVRLEAEFKAVSRLGDAVQLGLQVERLGAHSITLDLRCVGERGDDDVRMRMRQTIVTTSLVTHKAIEIPTDLRDAVARFARLDP